MTSQSRPLPRVIASLVRALAPSHRADTVIADLEHDFQQVSGRGNATRWLARETASLLSAYALARIGNWRRLLPMLLRDVQLVMRGLRRGTAALVAAAGLLSIGFAAVLLTIGLVETLLLRQVSAAHGEALRRIIAVDRQSRMVTRFSSLELQRIREHVGDSGDVTAVYLQPVLLRVNNNDVQTMAEIVDGRYFALTGTRTLLGRTLLNTDQRASAPPVTVLSEPFWRRYLNASPTVLGTTIQLNGAAYTVVGVAAALGSSTFLGASVDAWVALAHADPLLNAGWRTNVRDRWFTAFVLPVTSASTIDSRLTSAAVDLGRLYVDPWRDRRLQTGDATVMIGSQRSAATMLGLVLGGLAALILCAAASNVGSVLVARAAANLRAAAIHMSIGAGRAIVIRRQLLEGVLIGLASSLIAVALYAWARTQLAEVALLPTLGLRLDLPMTPRLLAWTMGGGIVLGLLLALGPALWSTRFEVAHALRDGDGRAGGSTRATTLRGALVSAQVCVSLVLIVGAVLFLQSLEALSNADLGFARDHLVAMDFDVEPVVRVPGDLPALAREALARVEALPDVVAAAMSNRAPVDPSTPTVELQIAGNDASRMTDVTVYLATERYFETVGVPIVQGRSFTAAEVATAADVAVVNESLARRLSLAGDAIDRAIHLPTEAKTLRIVGIARDSKYRTISESAHPHFYRPIAPGLGLTLLARTRADSRGTLRAIQRELDGVGPGVVGFFPRTIDDHLAVHLLPTRAAANAATLLGVLALLLSAAALYTLVSWFVVRRQREIGVRMALGASARDVRWLIVRQAVGAALPGAIVGIVLALMLGMAARSALYEVSPTDPVALGVGIVALMLVILIAGYLPSRVATTIDPATTLRN